MMGFNLGLWHMKQHATTTPTWHVRAIVCAQQSMSNYWPAGNW